MSLKIAILLFIAFFLGIESARIKRGTYGYNPTPHKPPPQPCGQYGSGSAAFESGGGGGYNPPNCNTYGQQNNYEHNNFGQGGGGGDGPSQFGVGAPGCGGGNC